MRGYSSHTLARAEAHKQDMLPQQASGGSGMSMICRTSGTRLQGHQQAEPTRELLVNAPTIPLKWVPWKSSAWTGNNACASAVLGFLLSQDACTDCSYPSGRKMSQHPTIHGVGTVVSEVVAIVIVHKAVGIVVYAVVWDLSWVGPYVLLQIRMVVVYARVYDAHNDLARPHGPVPGIRQLLHMGVGGGRWSPWTRSGCSRILWGLIPAREKCFLHGGYHTKHWVQRQCYTCTASVTESLECHCSH